MYSWVNISLEEAALSRKKQKNKKQFNTSSSLGNGILMQDIFCYFSPIVLRLDKA
jgi:hypothetical protein